MDLTNDNHTHEHEHAHSHIHNHTVTTTEQRAPTDESVKLLRELEAQAIASVLGRTRVNVGTFDCEVVITKVHGPLRYVAYAQFNFNGKLLTAEYTMSEFKGSIVKLAEGIRDAVAKVVATEIEVPFVIAIQENRIYQELEFS